MSDDFAAELLAEFGEPVTIVAPGVPAYDPITGDAQSGTAGATYTADGYPSAYHSGDVDGTSIRANDVRLVLAVFAVRPQRGWTATIDSVTYRIESVRAIRETGIDRLTICQLRAS